MKASKILSVGQPILLMSAIILFFVLRDRFGLSSLWLSMLFFFVADVAMIALLFWLNPNYRDLVSGAWGSYIYGVRSLGVKKNEKKK